MIATGKEIIFLTFCLILFIFSLFSVYLWLILDVDECEANVCQDGCVNTEPGYNCTCSVGTRLSEDMVSCEGNNNWVITVHIVWGQ